MQGLTETCTSRMRFSSTASASYDPEGGTLNYVWEIVGRPAGSTSSLDNPTAQKPIFVPDKQGAYTIVLIVSDGMVLRATLTL
jgi:hypothetical protein